MLRNFAVQDKSNYPFFLITDPTAHSADPSGHCSVRRFSNYAAGRRPLSDVAGYCEELRSTFAALCEAYSQSYPAQVIR